MTAEQRAELFKKYREAREADSFPERGIAIGLLISVFCFWLPVVGVVVWLVNRG